MSSQFLAKSFRPLRGAVFSCLLAVILLIMLNAAISIHALEAPPKPKGRVSDYTGTLNASEIRSLDEMLAQFERDTTNQLAVLIIPTLAGDSLEDYSIRLAEKWQIGQKGRDNGVILLIVMQDRKMRIEVGYGLEGTLPDSLAGDIIREVIAPQFRQGRFFQGIHDGAAAIIAATKGEYRSTARSKRKSSGGLISLFWTLFFFFFFMSAIIKNLRRRRYHSSRHGGRSIGGPFWWGGGFGGGGGLGGGFGGGFSGGGGGFGGGGASGGW